MLNFNKNAEAKMKKRRKKEKNLGQECSTLRRLSRQNGKQTQHQQPENLSKKLKIEKIK